MEFKGLKGSLSPDQISTQPEDLLKYGSDWLKQFKADPALVIFPKSTKDLQFIVNWAREHKHRLIPSGGRTGLSGGAVAFKKELVVSFDKMDRILEFNPLEGTVLVEAGLITQNLKTFAESKGFYFPLSFASEGSSQIGGNISTNAGGVHVLRFGTMRDRVLGLELVTGCGEILKLGRGLVKNMAGYDLKHLFIGSEGTLAFISKALLSLVPPPKNPQVFLMALNEMDHLLNIFQEFKKHIQPLAFEFFTDKALSYVLSHGHLNNPLSTKANFYLLMEIEEKDKDPSLNLFENLFEKGWLKEGLLSESQAQAQELWKLRENISESIAQFSPYKNDISVRPSKMMSFFKNLEQFLKHHYPQFESLVFGHLGDGNLHINILKPKNIKAEAFNKQCEKVSEDLFSLVKKYEGSISAEHGVGLLKKPYLHYSCSPEELKIMKSLKKLFDPDNVLNPGKIFDS